MSGIDFVLILHIIASVDPRGGGPIEGVLQQARQRELVGGDTTHIVTMDDPAAPFVRNCPQTVFALGPPAARQLGWRRRIPWRRYGYTPRLVPWLRKHAGGYDAIIVNGLWNYSALAARRALAGSGRPYVVFTHGMLDPWFRRTYPVKNALKQLFWLFCEGPLLNNARAVFFTTDEERVLARGAFWPYRVKERVVAYGTSDVSGDAQAQEASFRAQLPGLGARPYLLFLSRIHPKKGCDLLVSAFATVATKNPDLDLVIAGPDQTGWQGELQRQAERLGVGKRIHWPGMLSGDHKWGAFRGADAFILPSHQENFGIVVAEAMAAGTMVLISNKVNIWREVETDGAGLVENDDLDGTKRLLDRFMALTQDDRERMAAAARHAFLDRFEISNVARDIVVALKEEMA